MFLIVIHLLQSPMLKLPNEESHRVVLQQGGTKGLTEPALWLVYVQVK